MWRESRDVPELQLVWKRVYNQPQGLSTRNITKRVEPRPIDLLCLLRFHTEKMEDRLDIKILEETLQENRDVIYHHLVGPPSR